MASPRIMEASCPRRNQPRGIDAAATVVGRSEILVTSHRVAICIAGWPSWEPMCHQMSLVGTAQIVSRGTVGLKRVSRRRSAAAMVPPQCTATNTAPVMVTTLAPAAKKSRRVQECTVQRQKGLWTDHRGNQGSRPRETSHALVVSARTAPATPFLSIPSPAPLKPERNPLLR